MGPVHDQGHHLLKAPHRGVDHATVAEGPVNSGRIRAVGAVVLDGAGRLLLVLRARPPAAGTWSLPGGRVEAGESDQAALIREVAEETGLRVTVGDLVGTVERPGAAGTTYVINDYVCIPVGGQLAPGDDAAEARWWRPVEVRALPTSPLLVETLEQWGLLPPA
jgi:8-oxo-dGTP diphosphatase